MTEIKASLEPDAQQSKASQRCSLMQKKMPFSGLSEISTRKDTKGSKEAPHGLQLRHHLSIHRHLCVCREGGRNRSTHSCIISSCDTCDSMSLVCFLPSFIRLQLHLQNSSLNPVRGQKWTEVDSSGSCSSALARVYLPAFCFEAFQ